MRDRIPQTVGTAAVAEQVARDQKYIHLMLLAKPRDGLDGPSEVIAAIDPPEAVAQVPVGGVQDAQ